MENITSGSESSLNGFGVFAKPLLCIYWSQGRVVSRPTFKFSFVLEMDLVLVRVPRSLAFLVGEWEPCDVQVEHM